MPTFERVRCGVARHELVRHHAGELAAERSDQIAAHAAGCDRCREYLATLDRSRAEIASEAPAASAQILARLEAPPAMRRWRWPALAAASLGAALIAGIAGMPPPFEGGEVNRIKGAGVSLKMFVNRPDGPLPAGDGVALAAGDQVQFRYVAGGRRYLYVASVDGRGVITPLYPADGSSSVRVEPSGERVLAGSIILDDAVGPERVFAFFSDQPLDFDRVEARLQAALRSQAGDLRRLDRIQWEGSAVEQATVWFEKR